MEFIGNITTTESPITGITSALQNAGNTPSIQSGTLSSQPTAGIAGRLFISTDGVSPGLFRDSGSAWVQIAGAGGAGGAAGATTQVQINLSGSTYADSSFSYDPAVGVLKLLSPTAGVILNGCVNEPTSSDAGTGQLYAGVKGGRLVPKWIGPNGVNYLLQPHLGGNNIRAWRGANTTAVGTFASVTGSMPYTAASPTSITTPVLSSSNLLSQTKRSTISTSTTTGSIAFIRSNTTEVWRGNNTEVGGFFVIMRFALSGVLRSSLRSFAGLTTSIANPTNIDPVTSNSVSGIGIACNSATGNWYIVNNEAGTTRSNINLGASFKVTNTSLLELVLFSPPNGNSFLWQVTDLSTGAVATGEQTNNLPIKNDFLAPVVWVTNNSTSGAQSMDFVSVYVETDF